MGHNTVRIALLLTASLAADTAMADFLAPDPGTQISIQYNFGGVLVVRPVGGVWTHPLCPDVTAAVFSPDFYPRGRRGQFSPDFSPVYEMLVQAAMNGRSVNLRVSDTECHPNGYPLILSLRVFP
jgi:hypothetical protein